MQTSLLQKPPAAAALYALGSGGTGQQNIVHPSTLYSRVELCQVETVQPSRQRPTHAHDTHARFMQHATTSNSWVLHSMLSPAAQLSYSVLYTAMPRQQQQQREHALTHHLK